MNRRKQIKEWIRKGKKSKYRLVVCFFEMLEIILKSGLWIKRIVTDANKREIAYMKLFHGDRVHQTTAATCLNRYPVIFSACRAYFEDRQDIRILSFGCATGEEVVTLRQYFPNAYIVGAEINRNSLKVCRKRKLDNRICFIDSTPENLEKYGPYDAVFCMAVFQRTPGIIEEKNINDLSDIYPFSKFENQVQLLDRYLNQKGLMVIHMSQYDFSDTSIFSGYRPYGMYHQNYYSPYVFGRDSKRKIPGYRHSIFIKER